MRYIPLLLLLAFPAVGDEKPVRVPVVRDTWLSNVGEESDTTNGGAERLKVKSFQEMSLFDIDPAPLKGRLIKAATLHLRITGDERLGRITVGTVGAEWVEGKGTSYATEVGASTFRNRRHPDVPWTIPGSDFCSVIFGQGGTIWGNGDASAPDADGWVTIPVDPRVLRARVAGIGYGFVLFDDTGSEWTRAGEKFTRRILPNRFVHSREAGEKNAPYLTVTPGDVDQTPPGAVTEIQATSADLPAGEAMVGWRTPADTGAGVAGFQVRLNDADVPRYLIPAATAAGKPAIMHVRDLGLKAGTEVELVVRAVDGAGNVGEPSSLQFRVSAHEPKSLPGKEPALPPPGGELPKVGGATVMVVDELDKFDPVTGAMTPLQGDSYPTANHLWTARTRQVQLHAAKGEILGFQIAVKGKVKELRPALTFPKAEKVAVTFGRYANVRMFEGAMPDPIVPLYDGLTIPSDEDQIDGQQFGSLHVEVWVPKDTPAGDHAGTLTLQVGDEKLELPVTLRVWDFTLPDRLSFLAEMNAYGVPSAERGYYRLAHRHRTVFNAVPYSQSGIVADGWAPGTNGKDLDFLRWDRRFGPYFDGSAFADLPRSGAPLDCFYLPLHENWPTPVAGNYDGTYWADTAFSTAHRRRFMIASRRFAEHVEEMKWHDTLFQCFLNNKVEFKQYGWSRASSPWLLDEPANFQDFWALRYFAQAFHDGVSPVPGKGKVIFRADISRPMWQRDTLDDLLDYNVVNGDWRRYRRMVLDRKRANGEIVLEYGSGNAVDRSNLQPVGWCLDAWSLGADGVLPWLAVGSETAWKRAESTSLLYPTRPGELGPMPSVRLKGFLRGQQDVEYLTLLSQVMGEPRWSVGQQVRDRLKLVGKREGTGAPGEDAGIISYDRLLPQDVWALRVQIGEELSRLRPPAKDRLIELRTPRRIQP